MALRSNPHPAFSHEEKEEAREAIRRLNLTMPREARKTPRNAHEHLSSALFYLSAAPRETLFMNPMMAAAITPAAGQAGTI